MTTPPTRRELHRHLKEADVRLTRDFSPLCRFHERFRLAHGTPDTFHHHGSHRRHAYTNVGDRQQLLRCHFLPSQLALLTASGFGVLLRADWLWSGDEGARVGGLLKTLDSLPVRGFNLLLPGSDSASQLPGQPSVPGAPGTFQAVHYPEDRWVHPHGNRHRMERFDFVSYYVHQRLPTFRYAGYKQPSSSSGDDQPPSPRAVVFVQRGRPASKPPIAGPGDNSKPIESHTAASGGLPGQRAEPTAPRHRTQLLPASAPDLFLASPQDREREESEEGRHRERTRRGDAPAARSPRSPPPRPASSLGEHGLLGATEVPSLQSSPSPCVSANETPPLLPNHRRSPLMKIPLLLTQRWGCGVTSHHPYYRSVRVCLLPQGTRLPLPRHHYLLGSTTSFDFARFALWLRPFVLWEAFVATLESCEEVTLFVPKLSFPPALKPCRFPVGAPLVSASSINNMPL
ncbi:hypothetical protein Efla_007520 [Eimeria flavescens]